MRHLRAVPLSTATGLALLAGMSGCDGAHRDDPQRDDDIDFIASRSVVLEPGDDKEVNFLQAD